MNILPKKRWHVRNKDNKARVQKDEALAAEEEKEHERRAAFAEKEATLDTLRQRDSSYSKTQIEDVPKHSTKDNQHFNLFDFGEQQGNSSASNKEHEAEKKEEQETYEKRLGILTYLGQSHQASKSKRVWELNEDEPDPKKSCTEEKIKDRLDPMRTIKKYLKKDKKQKDKSKKKRKSDKEKIKYSNNLEAMRAERLKREHEERTRTRQLLSGNNPSKAVEPVTANAGRYNSQYNPHLVKQKWKD